MGKRLTEEEKERIVQLRSEGKSIRQIAREVGRGRGTVERVIKSYRRKEVKENEEITEGKQKKEEEKKEGEKEKNEKEMAMEISREIQRLLEKPEKDDTLFDNSDNNDTVIEKEFDIIVERPKKPETQEINNTVNTPSVKHEEETEVTLTDMLLIAGLCFLALSDNPILQKSAKPVSKMTGFFF